MIRESTQLSLRLLRRPSLPQEEGFKLLERAVDFEYLGEKLQTPEPQPPFDILAYHDEMERRTGGTIWSCITHYDIESLPPLAMWTLNPEWRPRSRAALLPIWDFMLAIAPHVIETVKPDVALITELDELPEPKTIAAGRLPPFFGVWTWIADSWLPKGAEPALRALPAHRVASLAGGIAVQAVADPSQEPSAALLEALGALGTRYLTSRFDPLS